MPDRSRLIPLLLAIGCLLGTLHARAQTPEPSRPAQPEPRACTERDRLSQADSVETDGRRPAQGDSPDQLARADSVICPPRGVDPHIRTPAPATGSEMPVIKPPADAR